MKNSGHLGSHPPSSAQTVLTATKLVVLTATVSDRGFDQAPHDGVFESVFGSPSVVQITEPPIGNFASAERTAVEFPLAGIPPGATIHSVHLQLTPSGGPGGNLGLSAGEAAIIDGYQGDGVITLPDMTAGAQVGEITGPTAGGVVTVTIDKAFIAGLAAGGATHAGLLFRGKPAAMATLFSFQAAYSAVPAVQRPRLRVRYL